MVFNERAIGTLGTSGGRREREMDSIGATQANFLPRSSVPPSLAKGRRGRGPAGPHARPMRWNQTTVVSPMAEVATTDGREGGREGDISPSGGGRRRRTATRSLARTGQLSKQADGLCVVRRRGAAGKRVHTPLHRSAPRTRDSTFQVLVVVLGPKQSDLTRRERQRERG